jgi:hypothetical protein
MAIRGFIESAAMRRQGNRVAPEFGAVCVPGKFACTSKCLPQARRCGDAASGLVASDGWLWPLCRTRDRLFGSG